MLGSPCYRLSTAQLVHSTGGTRSESVRYTASDFCAELFSCSPFQLHPIKHPRLLNHPTQYHIIHIIRRYILGIQAHAFIFSRLRFSADVNTGYSLVECLREIDEREAKHEEC